MAGIQDSQSYSPECTVTLKTTSSDIAGIKDSQSYSPEYIVTLDATTSNVTDKQDSQSYLSDCNVALDFQRYKPLSMDVFLDLDPLPSNLEEVDRQSTGKKFHLLHALNPTTVKTEAPDLLSSANSFWKHPEISIQLTRFLDNWEYDRNFNSRYHLGFVDCLLELMWI